MKYYHKHLKNKERVRAKYGVKYVYKEIRGQHEYWRFHNRLISVGSKKMSDLKQKVLAKGQEWEVVREDIYNQILESEKND